MVFSGYDLNQLHDAAERGDAAEIKQLLSAGYDVNVRVRSGPLLGQTPLHRVMCRNLFDKNRGRDRSTLAVVEALLNAGADADACDERNNDTPLHLAARYCTVDIVEALIKHGADIEARDRAGKTPLHCATGISEERTALPMVKLLLDAGADVNARDKEGNTPLRNALFGDAEIVALLLASGADVKIRDNHKETPLHLAVQLRKAHAAVILLLDAGADINARNMAEETPLHVAAWWNRNPYILEALIKHGADIEARDRAGKTPLYAAVENIEAMAKEMVNLLLDAGADVNVRDKVGEMPLHAAAGSTLVGMPNLVKILIKRGADVNARDEAGQTPLHTATSGGLPDVVEILVKHGADVNVRDKVGEMPLHIAIWRGLPKAEKTLLDAGASCLGFPWLSRFRRTMVRRLPWSFSWLSNFRLAEESIPVNNWRINQVAKKLLRNSSSMTDIYVEGTYEQAYLLTLMLRVAKDKEYHNLYELLMEYVYFESPETQMKLMFPDGCDGIFYYLQWTSDDEAKELLAEAVESNLGIDS